MTITYSMILATASVVSTLAIVFAATLAIIRWVNRQTGHEQDIRHIQEEQAILTRGVLACLKGLQEVGCDGPVEEAIQEIDNHLNEVAHRRPGGDNE